MRGISEFRRRSSSSKITFPDFAACGAGSIRRPKGLCVAHGEQGFAVAGGANQQLAVGRNKLYEVPTVSCRFPAYIYVPYYDPLVVFGPPGPGFFIGAAIRWGPAVIITGGFFSFGWAYPYFVWGAHAIYFDRTPWSRVWVNRAYYVHPYAHPWVVRPGPRVEVHPIVHRR